MILVHESTTAAQWEQLARAVSYATKDKNESDLVKGASIFFGPDFIEVHAESGGHTSMLDRDSFCAYLPADAAIQEIVPLVQNALAASHSWWPDKFVATGGWRGMSDRWKAWLVELHQRVPAKKSKASLFKGVRWLEVKRRKNLLTLIPKARVWGDEYGYIKAEDQTLELVFDLDEPGFSWDEALRKAMDKCEG